MDGNFDEWLEAGCPVETSERTGETYEYGMPDIDGPFVGRVGDSMGHNHFPGKVGAVVGFGKPYSEPDWDNPIYRSVTVKFNDEENPRTFYDGELGSLFVVDGVKATRLQVQPIEGMSGRATELSRQMLSFHSIKSNLSSIYLVKGWLDRGAFSVVYGESNVGKTFFALDLAMHVAARKDWHGNRAPAEYAGPVVYVASEGGAGINNRIAAIKRERGDLVEGIELYDGFRLLPTTLDLCTSTDAAHLATLLAQMDTPPALVVIDTLARAMGGGDENTAKDMGAFVRSIDFLREKTGAHVMVIHHSGKDASKGARGSGSLRAAADTEIELTRSGVVVMAETKKQRDMPTGEVFAYTLRSVFIGNDEDGDAVTSAVVEISEPVKKVTRLKGQALIALQAFGDALADHGETKTGEAFPSNRKCVSLDHWRDYCDRHSLTDGSSDSAARTAFGRAWKGLQEKEIIRVLDGFAWRCADE